ncbi:MAG: RNA methyltransferase, partial [Herpetosiphonaceae bacterium]|nr:RNA methyltransferase [Herpetosiphonaceae bacterium]
VSRSPRPAQGESGPGSAERPARPAHSSALRGPRPTKHTGGGSAPRPGRPRRPAPARPPMGDATRPVYLVQTQPGLGALAWSEMSTALRKPTVLAQRHVPQKDDVTLLQTASPTKELFDLRTVEDVFVLAVRAFNIAPTANGLKQIHTTVKQSPMVSSALNTYTAAGNRLPKITNFRVITRATGRQEYPRKAIGEAVADAIRDSWPGRWRLVEEDADVEVWVTLFASELVVALRLSDATMRHRGPDGGREVNRPAALRPVIAAAMVRLTDPQADDVFLDPMAGTGTLVAERAIAGPFDRLIAGDKSREAVKALTKNLQTVGGDLAIRRLDAEDLPFADGEISKIAVNLPFGKQVNHPDELTMLYQGAFREWVRVVRPGGLIVALASDIDRVREVMRLFPELRVRGNYAIGVLGQAATILLIERKNSS